MKPLFRTFAVISVLLIIPLIGQSQCKTFTKNNCLQDLEPYVYDGQLNSAILTEGDVAELLLTLYGGQDYRILVCGQEILGSIEFNLYDTNRNLIFSNKDHDYTTHWDFTSNSTQQLIVQVVVPKQESNSEMLHNGCVSILKGFKE
ncbi:MAG: hypothetical protein ABIJ16_14155 [Bacteroidota bacterium]